MKKLDNNDLKKVDGGRAIYYQTSNKMLCSSKGTPLPKKTKKSKKSGTLTKTTTKSTLTKKKKK